MAPSNEMTALVAEINRATYPLLLVWLRKALGGLDRRLPLDRDETPAIGILRLWPYLDDDAREFLRDAAVVLVRGWVNSEPLPDGPQLGEDEIDELLVLVRDIRPAPVLSLLWALINNAERFDDLPRPRQIDVQNLLEEWAEPVHEEMWVNLLKRDPARFGVTAFGALARNNLHAAITILAELPASYEITHSLELRVRWFISLLPGNGRAAWLQLVAQTLQRAPWEIRKAMQTGFAQCGSPLPEVTAPAIKSVSRLALYTLGNSLVETNACDALNRLTFT